MDDDLVKDGLVILVYVFPTTLDDNAGTWFKTLRHGNMYNFGQLKYLFLMNFMQLRKGKGDSHSING